MLYIINCKTEIDIFSTFVFKCCLFNIFKITFSNSITRNDYVKSLNLCFFENTCPFCLMFNISNTIYFLKRTDSSIFCQNIISEMSCHGNILYSKNSNVIPKNSVFIGHAPSLPDKEAPLTFHQEKKRPTYGPVEGEKGSRW